jgi:hypothetical protein
LAHSLEAMITSRLATTTAVPATSNATALEATSS